MKILLTCAFAILGAGCGWDGATFNSPAGTWFGTMNGGDVEGLTLSMTLVENERSVTGSALHGGIVVGATMEVQGEFSPPGYLPHLVFREGGLPRAILSGTFFGNTLTGRYRRVEGATGPNDEYGIAVARWHDITMTRR
jgi:hypothetical protein